MPTSTLCLIGDPSASAGTPPRLTDASASDPHVRVSDLGVNRGDGVFEVAGCLAGRVQALDAHLDRLARSAAMLDLPAPNLEHYRAAVHRCVDALTVAQPDRELLVKFVYTRGQEMGAPTPPTGWAMAYPNPDHSAQRAGIDVVTLSRGIASGVGRDAPWLLPGAKSLSYAVNRAAMREAARRGAHDVLFVSTDGHALEGPSSSLIARIRGVLVSPHPDEGVLPGTTQADVFAWAAARGVPTQVRPVPASELADADALWLVASGRLCSPIRSLDGRPYAVDAALTAEWNAALLARG